MAVIRPESSGSRESAANGTARAVAAQDLPGRLLQASPFGVVVLDDSANVSWANEAAADMVELSIEELVGRNAISFVNPDDADLMLRSLAFADDYGDLMGPVAVRYVDADGEDHYSRFWARNLTCDPVVGGIILVLAKEAALDVLDAAVAAVASDAELATSLELIVRSISRDPFEAEAAVARFGDPERACAVATTGAPLIATTSEPDLPWVVAATERRSIEVDDLDVYETLADLGTDFQAVWCRPIPTGGTDYAVLTVWTRQSFPITPNQSLQLTHAVSTAQLAFRQGDARDELEHAAMHDPLTGLANREMLRSIGDEVPSATVLFVDLDDFKDVNDNLGHPAGDRVLRTVAKRIRAAVRSTDYVVRFGGDEFLVVTTPARGEALAIEMAERIVRVVRAPVHLREATVEVGASVGVAVSDHPCTLDALIEKADKALLDVKSGDRGTWKLAV